MQLRKAIISAVLLFTYSIGFAHELIPHTHGTNFGNELMAGHSEKQHVQEHHSHVSDPNGHEHIVHQNHCDDGMFDLMACLLDEAERPASASDNCFYMPARTDDLSSGRFTKAQFAAVLRAVFIEWDGDEVSATFNIEADAAYLPPPLSSSPHRGPPSLFS